ncbi:unnamed protein product [Symbiodinium microadriaticum]|nr:unnamed protein product [Symbiodinium microadriaticum]
MARLRLVVHSNYDKIRAKTSRAERMLLDDFLKDPSQFTKGPGFLQKKENAEAEGPVDTVVGLLQAMVGDFQRDLQEEQEEDAKLEKSYQALVAAKTGEVTAAEDQVSTKATAKASVKAKVAAAKSHGPQPVNVPCTVPPKARPVGGIPVPALLMAQPVLPAPQPADVPQKAGTASTAGTSELPTWTKASAPVASPVKTEAESKAIEAAPEKAEKVQEKEELSEDMQRKLQEWWQRIQARAKPGPEEKAQRRTRERARLKADLARDELEESSRRRAASKQLRQDEAFLRCMAGGRLLALDLTANLRDCRMLASVGSSDALREALAELLLTMRRARGLCVRLHEDQRELQQDFASKCEREEEGSRQRRLGLLRRLEKLEEAKEEEPAVGEEPKQASEPDCLSLLTAGGVPLLAELAHEAGAEGLDLDAASDQVVAPPLRDAQVVVRQLRELLLQAGLNQPPVKRRRPEEPAPPLRTKWFIWSLRPSKEASVGNQEEEKATAAEKVTTGKADVAGATKAKAEAEKLLATVTEKCASSKAEFEQRSATRTEELSAVTKAVKALQGDEAKSLLSTAASFLQLQAVDQRQARAAEVLSAAGRRLGNQAMITLGLQAKGDGILKVQEAIDGMVRSLTQQQKDEVKEHDGCQKDFSDNKASTDEKTELKGSTKGKISQLQSDITTTEETISKLKEDSEEMAKQLQAAKENREKEMGEFADTVAEQQHTQKLLGEALEALQAFYAKPALVQVRRHQADPKPEDFKDYKNNAGGEKVMALIREVSDSSATLEKEAKQADEDSRIAFEKLSDETKAEMRSATEETNNKAIHKADLEADLAEAKQVLRLTKDELESLSDSKDAIHKSCDFVVDNFAVRQEARGQEIKALEEAKAILG